ncbi:alanine dehydrogenase [Siccirubricoccus sp. KC 17139]|uniref:Alanine dehydrogenase n=1 Tax=Siccirubricoccus soli TaxID=2899147 RepID=A0ABT1DBP1_9PROT|nr:alanine dehydrogenase [Siccirubricoccus soli]MCO6419363.1 alanine dehydrogenase [Siccirubricoccus soli]MCP2685498.1 alanine dehydrogenase [Siccirubricoccus soli]
MLIGVPREVKNHEYRVGLVPASVRELTSRGHRVLVETGAGAGIGFPDATYAAAGAAIAPNAAQIFATAELVVKVKEPQPAEWQQLRPGQILFTYLHLAPDPEQTRGLLESRCTAIAYETVTSPEGGLPLLAPMSEVAGRMAVQVGARCLEKELGGAGILLSGVPGVPGARVAILGGGVVGSNAARIAAGMRARVVVLDRSPRVLDALDREFGGQVATLFATAEAVEQAVTEADLVIGAVLVPGAAAPRLVTRAMLGAMRPGSVLVDVAIDQGGCFETSRPTTHAEPTYVVDGIIHYCVTNMPGAVARTSAVALNNATLPFVVQLAELGFPGALAANPHLAQGLNLQAGRIVHPAVAAAMGMEPLPLAAALAG